MARDVMIITGACGGIGQAMARRFASDYRLLLCDISEERLAGLRAELAGDHEIQAGDVAAAGTIERIVARSAELGRFQALIHTAGISPGMGDARSIMAVNLLSSVRITDALLPYATPGSVVVLIASMSGHKYPPSPLDPDLLDPGADGALDRLAVALDPVAAYRASKRGVILLCEARCAAWGERGARIVTISPGPVETAMIAKELASSPTLAAELALTPLGRHARADEIVDAAAFLCSDQARFVTGADLRVDGGLIAAARAGKTGQP
jgi:NAD(P)-dependent dehydrogenase (short-subunit alcohol dehydrogenase family)